MQRWLADGMSKIASRRNMGIDLNQRIRGGHMSFETTQYFVKQATEILGFSDRVVRMLMTPHRSIKTEVSFERDNGNIASFTSYRIQHNQALGPMKGGISFHPSVNENEMASHASLMTWKTALLKLPFGGAQGGVECDPSSLSPTELEHLTKAYTVKIKEVIGPNLDIPGPDINTDPQIMAWIMSEYSKHYGHTPAVVTGKPIFLHGSEIRERSTGLGIAAITEKIMTHHNDSIQDKNCVIQGFGHVGYHAAQSLVTKGAKIIAVSDKSTALHDPKGLDIAALRRHQQEHGTLKGYNGAEAIDHEGLLELTCDVLIPAAIGEVFNRENANRINCRYLIEGANAPTNIQADDIFNRRNIIVVPDILANAGGVTVSYFEWVQNIQQYKWHAKHIQEELFNHLNVAFDRVIEIATKEQCSLRTAAYLLSVGRVAKACVTLGL